MADGGISYGTGRCRDHSKIVSYADQEILVGQMRRRMWITRTDPHPRAERQQEVIALRLI
jgi:hypothetical protein